MRVRTQRMDEGGRRWMIGGIEASLMRVGERHGTRGSGMEVDDGWEEVDACVTGSHSHPLPPTLIYLCPGVIG